MTMAIEPIITRLRSERAATFRVSVKRRAKQSGAARDLSLLRAAAFLKDNSTATTVVCQQLCEQLAMFSTEGYLCGATN